LAVALDRVTPTDITLDGSRSEDECNRDLSTVIHLLRLQKEVSTPQVENTWSADRW
jgi:hypothetical protein